MIRNDFYMEAMKHHKNLELLGGATLPEFKGGNVSRSKAAVLALLMCLLVTVVTGFGPIQSYPYKSDTGLRDRHLAVSLDMVESMDVARDSGFTEIPTAVPSITPSGVTAPLGAMPTPSPVAPEGSPPPPEQLSPTGTPLATETEEQTTSLGSESTGFGHSAVASAQGRAFPTSDGQRRSVRVPILMYHYISDPPQEADALRRDLSLPGPDFEVQLRYLANEGYHSISLSDLVMHLQRGTPLPEKPIVLTFDDGYKDAFTVAFPLLKKYGFVGTFFIFTKPIDQENRNYLSWRDVELMSAGGMEFGSHSATHPDLRGKPREFLLQEIIGSKEAIETHTGQPVRFFCYPSGSYDRKVMEVVKGAGYWAAVTVQQGVEHSSEGLLELSRIRIRGSDGLERFDLLLNMDW